MSRHQKKNETDTKPTHGSARPVAAKSVTVFTTGEVVSVPRFFVKIKGTPKVAEIEAATFEEAHREGDVGAILLGSPGDRVAKDADGKQVAWFSGDSIAAWWIEPGRPDLKVSVEHIGQDKPGNDTQH